MKNDKFAHAERFIQRKRIVRTVGLDTDIFLALMQNNEEFTLFRPRIFNRKNVLYINYRIFAETLGVLRYKYNFTNEDAVKKIFAFLRMSHIKLLKKSETDMVKLTGILSELKRYRDSIKNLAGDKDLEVIAIYRAHNIDCIMGRNSLHFLPFCNHLDIEFEKLEENVGIMFRQAFGWQKRRKKY
jgi:hypothetical protein